MTSGLPAAATYNVHLLQAALRAQSVASCAMAVYLIAGGGWVATALVSVAYRDRLPDHMGWLPMVCALAAGVWCVFGGWLMRCLHAKAQACSFAYDVHLQQVAQARNRPTGWQNLCKLWERSPLGNLREPRPVLPTSLFGIHLRSARHQQPQS